ncbi:hypothetical protein VQ056_12585 [Paenibacillus sp. JTLBN-2024]
MALLLAVMLLAGCGGNRNEVQPAKPGEGTSNQQAQQGSGGASEDPGASKGNGQDGGNDQGTFIKSRTIRRLSCWGK